MPLTDDQVAAILTKLDTVADSLEKFIGGEHTRAETEKVRADADKVRADTDKVRSDTEDARANAHVKLETAQADLDAKRIANEKSRVENEAARVDKLIEQVTGAVPDLSSLSKSTVTFSGTSALRQAEATERALEAAAKQVADAVVAKAAPGECDTGPLYVTSATTLAATVATYRRITTELGLLKDELEEARTAADAALSATRPVLGLVPLAAPPLVIAALAGKVVTQAASLFELDVSATTNRADVPALSVQAAVVHQLLAARANLEVVHDSIAAPVGDSAVLGHVMDLVSLDLALASRALRLDEAIKDLGNPAGDLADARTVLATASPGSDVHRAAQAAADDAERRLGTLGDLKDAKARATAAVEKAKAFVDALTAVPEGGASPLTAALAVEGLVAGVSAGAEPYVLVVGGATAETGQLTVARRIFAPRLQTSTAVGVDYFLVRGRRLVAAGRATGAVSYHGRVKRYGASWSKLEALP